MEWHYYGPVIIDRFGVNAANTLTPQDVNLAWWQVVWLLHTIAPGLPELFALNSPNEALYLTWGERDLCRQIKKHRSMACVHRHFPSWTKDSGEVMPEWCSWYILASRD